jgi:hypothetical protein
MTAFNMWLERAQQEGYTGVRVPQHGREHRRPSELDYNIKLLSSAGHSHAQIARLVPCCPKCVIRRLGHAKAIGATRGPRSSSASNTERGNP